MADMSSVGLGSAGTSSAPMAKTIHRWPHAGKCFPLKMSSTHQCAHFPPRQEQGRIRNHKPSTTQKQTPASYYLAGAYMVRSLGFEPRTHRLKVWHLDFIWTRIDPHRIAEMLFLSAFYRYYAQGMPSFANLKRAMCLWIYCGCVHKRPCNKNKKGKPLNSPVKIIIFSNFSLRNTRSNPVIFSGHSRSHLI